MKQQLIFDATDANTIADSDSVGAFIRAADGTLITHTAGALDVNLKSPIQVAVDLAHTEDSVRLGDGTDLFTSTSAAGKVALDVNFVNTSIEVTATDLDIRDLSSATDSVASWLRDGSGNAISSTAGALDVNIASSAPLEVQDAALANVAIASAALSVAAANVAQDVVSAPLANRKYLHVYNNDNRKFYIGQNGVTAATGFPVAPGAYIELRAGAAVDVEVVSEKVGHDIRTLELS